MAESMMFVCLGNICRSPLVEAVARAEFARAGMDIEVTSCGTGHWHVGEGADARAIDAAATGGYDLREHRARQLGAEDFRRHRWVLAMDEDNLKVLREACPPEYRERLGLFLETAGVASPRSVPDPYHGGDEGFAEVLDLARRGVNGLIERLRDPRRDP